MTADAPRRAHAMRQGVGQAHADMLGQPVGESHLDFPSRQTCPRAAILVLHGGKATSRDAVTSNQLTVRRMQLFTRSLRSLGDDLAVVQLRYRVRGWNGAGDDVLADVASALGSIGARYGDVPVVLVGHSMGGRAALRAAGHPSVTGVVALAPWFPDFEPLEQLRGRGVAVLHGTCDATTSPLASARLVTSVAPIARRAVCVHVPWSGHGMLLRAVTWHRLTAAFAAAEINDAPFDAAIELARQARCRPCKPDGER